MEIPKLKNKIYKKILLSGLKSRLDTEEEKFSEFEVNRNYLNGNIERKRTKNMNSTTWSDLETIWSNLIDIKLEYRRKGEKEIEAIFKKK